MKKQKVISGIVAGTLVLAFIVAPVNGATLSEQLAESNVRQTEAKYQVDMTQNTITGIETEVGKVNDEVNRISGVIDSINTEVAGLEANITKAQEELGIAEAKRLEQEGAMSDRIRTMYMYGNGSIMEFLFSATDFSDFVTKLDMSRYIIEADKDALLYFCNDCIIAYESHYENRKHILKPKILTEKLLMISTLFSLFYFYNIFYKTKKKRSLNLN